MRDVTPIDPVVAALKQKRRAVNNSELAQIMGWSDATASRTARDLARQGKVKRWREGKEMMTAIL
jgi:predicted transcriptional regulator